MNKKIQKTKNDGIWKDPLNHNGNTKPFEKIRNLRLDLKVASYDFANKDDGEERDEQRTCPWMEHEIRS
jgi:hypothetical protein